MGLLAVEHEVLGFLEDYRVPDWVELVFHFDLVDYLAVVEYLKSLNLYSADLELHFQCPVIH